MTSEIEEFAKNLIRLVRDESIGSNDRELLPGAASLIAKRWKVAAKKYSPEEFALVLIPDIVDDVIFYLLHAIDNGELRLRYIASNGKAVDLTEEGLSELAGWYMGGKDNWRATFSQQRFVDDCADLA